MPKRNSSNKPKPAPKAQAKEDTGDKTLDRREAQAMMDRMSRFDEYVTYLQNRKRLLVTNFVAGMMRGMGFAVGFTILSAVVVMLLQRLARANLPGIGDFVAELIGIVQMKLY